MKRHLKFAPLLSLLLASAFIQPVMAVTPGDTTDGAEASDPALNSTHRNPADGSATSDRMGGTTSGDSTYDTNRSTYDTNRSATSQNTSDTAITAKVKSALMAERDLPSSQISVQTNDGVVQLNGFLNSQDEIDRAVSTARNVKDVKAVENNLQTK